MKIPVSGLALLLIGFSASSLAERETIAIIGTGDLGDSFGARFASLGYKVIYGSRNPNGDKAQGVVEKTGHGAVVVSQQEAASRGDIVFLPIGWPAMETAAKNLGDLDGKIVVDPSLPWAQGDDGYPVSQLETSSAEMIQEWHPDARVVKALGTMGSMIIDDPTAAGGIVTIPIASDHRDAKERVAQLVVELGLDPVDFGPLRMARFAESLGLIYMIPLLQQRDEEWEFYFRRNADWVCRWQVDWSAPVVDADSLPQMPETQSPRNPCP